MAVDAEFIGSEGFNIKFKNYLRDFYIYQFKERGSDFKVRGTNDKTDLNKDVIDGTYYPDVKRLQYTLEQAAGVQWRNGDVKDSENDRIDPSRINRRVECVTVDARQKTENPFFSLYRFCSESAVEAGAHFSFIYGILMYFMLWKRAEIVDYKPLCREELDSLDSLLKNWALDIYAAEKRNAKTENWRNFESKHEYANKAIKRYNADPTYYTKLMGLSGNDEQAEKIHKHIFTYKKKICFDGTRFYIENECDSFVEKSKLFYAMHNLGLCDDQRKNFELKMNELVDLGIITAKKEEQRVKYALSDIFLTDILGNDESFNTRFADMVSFFSQTSMLGVIGSYILNRLPERKNDFIYYKHNYLKRALNDYNNIDLLYAIENKYWTVIEYRNASMNDLEYQRLVCFPIEIRESVNDGRQYLIYYHPIYRSVSAVRIEFIDSITIGTMPADENFEQDIERARILIKHTWGTAFNNFAEGNLKEPLVPRKLRIVIKYDESEGFIRARVRRELRRIASFEEIMLDGHGRCIEITADVANHYEMLQWLRSYTRRIVSAEIDGEPLDSFTADIEKTYLRYTDPSAIEKTENISSKHGKTVLRDEIPENFKKTNDLHSLIFNEIFGIAFEELGKTLTDISKCLRISADEFDGLESEYASFFASPIFKGQSSRKTETARMDQADGFLMRFVDFKSSGITPRFRFTNAADSAQEMLPLTSIEIQWLNNILNHPFAKCFLTNGEIERLLAHFTDKKLFDINHTVLYDSFSDTDRFYDSEPFFETSRKIFGAIHDRRKLVLKYRSQYETVSDYLCAPVYIEYSKRDSRFRLYAICNNKVRTFNLERIVSAETTDESFDISSAKEAINTYFAINEREMVVSFDETMNVPDRILTEFSCFKKKCIKWSDSSYRMTLCYNSFDKREILIRLLSYGSLVFIEDDSGDVRAELISRLESQLSLSKELLPDEKMI